MAIGGLVEPPPAQAIGLENAPDMFALKVTFLVATPQDKDVVQGLDNGGNYGDGNDDSDANDDGNDKDGGEVRQRPKPPHHCSHKTLGLAPPQGRGKGRRGIGDTVTCKGECLTRPTTMTCQLPQC